MCLFFSSAPIDVTLITYSYSPKSFETPDQAPIYTSFTFNTEKSVRHALAYWTSIGTGHYGDIDLLFGDDSSKPHWSGLSKQEVSVMEINLRQRKVETVVQIVKSLEDLWRERFPPPNKSLWPVSAAYEIWNSLSEEIWKLHLMKYNRGVTSQSPTYALPFGPTRSHVEKSPSQKDLDFDGSSDAIPENPFPWTAATLGSFSREDGTPAPDLDFPTRNSAQNHRAGNCKNCTFRELDHLSQVGSEEFERDGVGVCNYLKRFGVLKSVVGGETALGHEWDPLQELLAQGKAVALALRRRY